MSTIDPLYPVDGGEITAVGLRTQFVRAKTDIEGLQTEINAITGGGYLLSANNLNDVANAATARLNLGIVDSVTIPHTAGGTLTTGQTGSTNTNTGASGAVALLAPSAAVDLEYILYVDTAQNLSFVCAGSNIIRNGSDVGSAGGSLVSNTIGNYAKLKCIIAGTWTITSIVGDWTLL